MGKKDDAIAPFFKYKERFSDLFNGALFHGRQLIFGMIKCKDDKEKLFNFTKDNESYFS